MKDDTRVIDTIAAIIFVLFALLIAYNVYELKTNEYVPIEQKIANMQSSSN